MRARQIFRKNLIFGRFSSFQNTKKIKIKIFIPRDFFLEDTHIEVYNPRFVNLDIFMTRVDSSQIQFFADSSQNTKNNWYIFIIYLIICIRDTMKKTHFK